LPDGEGLDGRLDFNQVKEKEQRKKEADCFQEGGSEARGAGFGQPETLSVGSEVVEGEEQLDGYVKGGPKRKRQEGGFNGSGGKQGWIGKDEQTFSQTQTFSFSGNFIDYRLRF
jgi:hypothetical protein